jgi:hypothetical protein
MKHKDREAFHSVIGDMNPDFGFQSLYLSVP